MMATRPPEVKKAFQLIVLFGLISLFGDVCYEGARSINGPFMATLSADAAIVGLIAGLGEFLGYALRLLSGYFSDKTKGYWVFTIAGYGLIISVPLLTLTGTWQFAAIFMVTERIGKALRSPARDAIVSSAVKQVGTGFGFGLLELMDQIGAIAGPLMIAAFFAFTGAAQKTSIDYRHAYALFWVPFIILMACVIFAFFRVPEPSVLEPKKINEPKNLSKLFWMYVIFTFLTSAGYINFAIIGYHFKIKNILSDAMIPVYYAVAMAVDGIMAIAIGKLYDVFKERSKRESGGMGTLIVIPVVSVIIPFFAFVNGPWFALAAIAAWGIVMGAHETIMRSSIADITPIKKRGTGYGIFSAGYGLAMLIGGFLAGILYDKSLPWLFVMTTTFQVAAIIVFFMMKREINASARSAAK
jgi:MFS family permease